MPSARALGVPPESIRVEVLPDAPPQVANALQARHAAVQAVEAAAAATRAALGELARDGYAFEDAVMMLGLSAAEIGHYAPRRRGPGSARHRRVDAAGRSVKRFGRARSRP